jgi:hypothetical protein
MVCVRLARKVLITERLPMSPTSDPQRIDAEVARLALKDFHADPEKVARYQKGNLELRRYVDGLHAAIAADDGGVPPDPQQEQNARLQQRRAADFANAAKIRTTRDLALLAEGEGA